MVSELMKNIAIVGAGLAGLTLAYQLKESANITLFEKSRGVGGRLATRWANPFYFDHGAQFFKAHSTAFKELIDQWLTSGVVARWDARFVEIDQGQIQQSRQWDSFYPHYVGVPHMNSVAQALSKDLNVQLNTPIAEMKKLANSWQLFDDKGNELGNFDWVVCAIPIAQAKTLITGFYDHFPSIASIEMKACFSLMLGFDQPLSLPFDSALVRNADISWISVNSSKPGRNASFTLLVNSTNAWANAHIDDDRDAVIAHLCQTTSQTIGQSVEHAVHKVVHGWRYANIGKQNTSGYVLDAEQQLALCGDWFIQGRVNAAFDSGMALSNILRPLVEQSNNGLNLRRVVQTTQSSQRQ